MNREFYDVGLEKSILTCLAHDDNFFTRLYYKGLPDEKVFADKSFRILFLCISEYYIKYAKLPTKVIVQNYIKRIPDIADNIRDKVSIITDRIYDTVPLDSEKDSFDMSYNELVSLYQLRSVQNHVKVVADKLESGDIEGITESIQSFSINKYDEQIEEFEYSEGFKERFDRINFFKKNYNKMSPVPTGLNDLDYIVQGGFLNELVLFVGNSSTGKSAALHMCCKNASAAKKNGILFTIEMNKIEAASRIDSDISNIPLNKFRNPKVNEIGEFDQLDVNKWHEKIKYIKSNHGKLFIVSFLNGANVSDISAKAREIMKRNRIRIDFIAIDYLNDLKPIGKKYDSSKDWNAQGEISWDLHLLTRSFINYDGTKGVPVITACTFKKGVKNITSAAGDGEDKRRLMDERDMGISPLLFQHADIVLGIREYNEEANQVIVMKCRSGKKGNIINTYPNWPYGRFHDQEKATKILSALAMEKSDSEDGLLLEGEVNDK